VCTIHRPIRRNAHKTLGDVLLWRELDALGYEFGFVGWAADGGFYVAVRRFIVSISHMHIDLIGIREKGKVEAYQGAT
jgi:hypothetical protein